MITHENRVARWDALTCVNFGFWESFERGVDPDKLRGISNRRLSTVYRKSE